MSKNKLLPVSDLKDEQKHNEVTQSFRELGKKDPTISIIGLIGPWLSTPYTERIESYGGYQCGKQVAYVAIGVDKTQQEEFVKPFEKNNLVRKTIEELHRKGISVSLEVVPIKEYAKNEDQFLKDVFGYYKALATIAYKK